MGIKAENSRIITNNFRNVDGKKVLGSVQMGSHWPQVSWLKEHGQILCQGWRVKMVWKNHEHQIEIFFLKGKTKVGKNGSWSQRRRRRRIIQKEKHLKNGWRTIAPTRKKGVCKNSRIR